MSQATAVDELRETATWIIDSGDAPAAMAASASAIAIAGAGGALLVISRDGRRLGSAAVPTGLLAAAWSPDGRVLALGGPGGAQLWTAEDGLISLPVSGWCSALAWSVAGQLAVASDRIAVVFDVTNPASATALWQTPEAPSTITALAWLRAGRELAVAAYGGVKAFTKGKLKPARSLDYVGSLLDIATSSDARWLVSGNQDASVHIWRLRDGAELEMSGFPSKVAQVEFHPDGRWLFADGGEQPTIWDFAGSGPGGRQPAMLEVNGRAGSTRFSWNPQAPLVAVADSTGVVRLWDATQLTAGESDAAHVRLVGAMEPVTALAWLGSDSLLVATQSGRVAMLGP
ncbi:WD40 repeat domain-containing protein [Propionicimonas sp.]|uniref:WD40 repeat domain-containing protein n=1 Tax=Propionicimonas sp. TaxID=1955623 RepID=UPI00181DBA0C|nr:WD40 repeat domain-containing protein [Propionicimonas sp.]MBU3976633.1 WD40 repeat domain-containing protein [Actinomycetota bacterium]MBA3020367.1 WD40 repeat domain-containing protein [Propionicimonas sp.]MBU3986540.1 WD40 repeat domain-containing protein [Actinomycetota bacterium]MBU4007308.1 WD40 repeat domain-containing protein [Actinomycetota bacterium]MBU4065061.1 WD40 repeat domain-containing protein [Actinomycetota bacterium]